MSVSTLPTGLPDRLLAQLEALPEFDPAPGGFERVLVRRRAARRRGLGLALAAGLAALAVAAGLQLMPNPAAPALDIAARTQALEADALSARPRALASAPVSALEGELARLDVALQAAYDRDAPPAELDRLWQARTETLSALVAAYRHSDSIVRI